MSTDTYTSPLSERYASKEMKEGYRAFRPLVRRWHGRCPALPSRSERPAHRKGSGQ